MAGLEAEISPLASACYYATCAINIVMSKKAPTQSFPDFLSQCGIRENSLQAMLALHMRKVLAVYASSDSGIRKAEHVFANHRIEGDLGIPHWASLDLIDVILEFEAEGISIDNEDARKLFELNERDATVAEIVREFIVTIESKTEQADAPDA